MSKIEEMFNIAEVSELMFEAKFAYLLEGFTYAEATELWFAARN
jgi:hypothetical protein